ncbi:MAG: hypothetical protein JSW71_06615, partial [Gemmatimonadota bacterium]
MDVVFCHSCGQPISRHLSGRLGGSSPRVDDARIIYPSASARELAPDEVRSADDSLAKDYDEAVKCEPYSLQAAAILLGLCASTVLVDKCGCNKSQTLGKQYEDAKARGKLSSNVDEQFEGLLQHRNRSAHPWFNE